MKQRLKLIFTVLIFLLLFAYGSLYVIRGNEDVQQSSAENLAQDNLEVHNSSMVEETAALNDYLARTNFTLLIENEKPNQPLGSDVKSSHGPM